MNLSKKTLGITAILYLMLALVPMSCGLLCRDSCGCGPTFPPQKFRIISFELITVGFDGQRIFPDDIRPWDEYFKGLEIKDFDFLSTSKTSWSSFGIALACDPVPPSNEKKVIDLKIINLSENSLGDGSVLKVGDDISDLFGVNDFFAIGLEPIDNYFSGGLPLYLDRKLKVGFLQDPGKELTLTTKISLILEGGTEFTFDQEPFTITTEN